jgi:hypothetical protein
MNKIGFFIACFFLLTACNTKEGNNRKSNEESPEIHFVDTVDQAKGKPISIKDYSGSWYWKSEDSSSSFKIIVYQNDDSVYGQYCAAYDFGNRLDCDFDTEYNINGRAYDSIALVKFSSFYGAKDGEATLTLQGNKLQWDIKKYPSGADCFAPKEASMEQKAKW